MATVKLTVTLPDHQMEAVRSLVADGKAPSVSGFVQHAVEVALHETQQWRKVLGAALAETGGPMTAAERRWADSVLSNRARRTRRARRRVS